MIASILIPAAPHHAEVAQRAIASANAQTMKCHVLHQIDTEMRGAGWLRNRLLERATTPFVVFLDADDELHPEFVERCVSVYDGTSYLYTDWLALDKYRFAPDSTEAFRQGDAHLVTTLLPTNWARTVGGFDESLACMEDTDLYLKLAQRSLCGKRIAEALVNYRAGGERSIRCRDRSVYAEINQQLNRRYGGQPCMCNCNQPAQSYASEGGNEWFEGAVLVRALYAPMKQVGPATRRIYPRVGLGAQLYVHRDDVAQRPQWWEEVYDPRQSAPDVEQVLALVELSKVAAKAQATVESTGKKR